MRALRPTLLDLAALTWLLACLWLGLQAADAVRELRTVPGTATTIGREVEGVGDALAGLDLPLVGGQVDEAAADVRAAGTETRRAGEAGQADVEDSAALAGWVVGLLPLAPLLALYLPLRVNGVRDGLALRVLQQRAAHDHELAALLLQRSLLHVSDRRLAAMPGRPWAGRPAA